ncbi:DUF2497 domain-containing protein [Chelativorans sp. AA-79]|uniref:PopZ family protein n=1 Tax=Chelativorans sp. AA-79 TaxID=3028735 RepID=UPI0023F7751F|nr:DUF2497 domain-containing protein [Chelativorans sp. AA-79]WEX07226.1 DUF2497 domain-containing protein [Chelativorans sp. AA-79]
MAQASSVQQREPSMEEILASIRRIIEDSEPGGRDEPSREQETTFRSIGEVEDLRPGLTEPSRSSPSGEGAQADSGEHPESPEAAGHAPQAARDSHQSVPFDASEEDEDEDGFSIPVAANAPAAPQPAQEEEPAHRRPSAGFSAHSAESDRRPILSTLPGRKVAAAFEELNEALLANRRKTLDQMAEEMLQPMLQDWLDNNLPQLVERLVREEIERIARGG